MGDSYDAERSLIGIENGILERRPRRAERIDLGEDVCLYVCRYCTCTCTYRYHPSLVKCRSAVIYLSRIDASPEVNGRVVTISPWTRLVYIRREDPCVRTVD